MAKRFFYVCAGLFLLALSWHYGAMEVRASCSRVLLGGFGNYICVIGEDGYFRARNYSGGPPWTWAEPPGS